MVAVIVSIKAVGVVVIAIVVPCYVVQWGRLAIVVIAQQVVG